jgi:hypothetical protein
MTGISKEKLPSINALQSWLDRAKQGSETPLKLLDGTPIRNIHKFDSKGTFTMPLGWSAQPMENGSLHGARLLDVKFDRMELWLGWNKKKKPSGEWAYYTRLIPTKRALRHLEQTLPGWWRHHRLEVCGTLPSYARKVGQLRKGDQILMPLSRAGEIDHETPYVQWWYEVTAVMASGKLEMKSLTYKSEEGTLLEHLGKGIITKTAMAAKVIASLLGKNDPKAEAAEIGLKFPID